MEEWPGGGKQTVHGKLWTQMPKTQQNRERFKRLHETGCFIIPNPWDIGSARYLQFIGFPALATSSAGYAFSLGKPDSYLLPGGALTLEETLSHLSGLVEACDVPINADFENGFAHDLNDLATNVIRCAETGVAGLSIEDNDGGKMYGFELAVDRIRTASDALKGSGVLLVARTEGYLLGQPNLDETIRRMQAFAEAGADCLYAPGVTKADEISALVTACQPKPVNILVNSPGPSLAQLKDLGVRRISVGGGLARVAWGAFMRAAKELQEFGTFGELGSAAKMSELNGFLETDWMSRVSATLDAQ